MSEVVELATAEGFEEAVLGGDQQDPHRLVPLDRSGHRSAHSRGHEQSLSGAAHCYSRSAAPPGCGRRRTTPTTMATATTPRAICFTITEMRVAAKGVIESNCRPASRR